MPWRFDVDRGTLYSPSGTIMAWGYSGFGQGRNNANMEQVHAIGPLPRGKWHFLDAINSEHTGPLTFPLEPDPQTNTFGRSGFDCHGDAAKHPGKASHGCLVLPRFARERIAESPDKELLVT
jgi:Tlde1 domain